MISDSLVQNDSAKLCYTAGFVLVGQFHGMAQVIDGDINHTLNREEGKKGHKI